MVEKRIIAPVGSTTSLLPAGNWLLAAVGASVGMEGGLRRINPEVLSVAITFLLILPVVASPLFAAVLAGGDLRYLPTQYARMCTGIWWVAHTSIANVIVLAYFIGGYFYEIESALTHDPAMKEICQLGYGKAKLTKLYFLRGLAKLAAWEEIQSLIDQKQLSREQLQDLLKYFKT